jgi:diguanylate cyclase (GGDEF)-like protein
MKVLLAEDSLTMMMTATVIIEKSGHEVIPARDGKEALSLFASENPDLVLLDVQMPIYNGFEVAKKIRSENKDKWVPIIFLTGCVGDDHLTQGIDAGGDDYLTKPVSSDVLNAKLNAMQRISEIQNKLLVLTRELSETNDKLQQSVVTDPLTGARNRLYLDECIKREWYRGMRYNTELSLLLIDVDNFKTLNDTNGHQAGDACLIELVKLFNSQLKRSTDALCRYGGDEFVIVLPDTSASNAMQIAEDVRKSVEIFSAEFNAKSPVDISVSIGCASFIPDTTISSDEFLTFADKALYAAKNAGRNCIIKATINTDKNIAA